MVLVPVLVLVMVLVPVLVRVLSWSAFCPGPRSVLVLVLVPSRPVLVLVLSCFCPGPSLFPPLPHPPGAVLAVPLPGLHAPSCLVRQTALLPLGGRGQASPATQH